VLDVVPAIIIRLSPKDVSAQNEHRLGQEATCSISRCSLFHRIPIIASFELIKRFLGMAGMRKLHSGLPTRSKASGVLQCIPFRPSQALPNYVHNGDHNMAVVAFAWAWNQRLSPSAKMILLTLADMANNFEDPSRFQCFPSIRHLMEKTALSETAVKDNIKDLIMLKLVIKEARDADNGRQTSNKYYLSVPTSHPMPQTEIPPDPSKTTPPPSVSDPSPVEIRPHRGGEIRPPLISKKETSLLTYLPSTSRDTDTPNPSENSVPTQPTAPLSTQAKEEKEESFCIENEAKKVEAVRVYPTHASLVAAQEERAKRQLDSESRGRRVLWERQKPAEFKGNGDPNWRPKIPRDKSGNPIPVLREIHGESYDEGAPRFPGRDRGGWQPDNTGWLSLGVTTRAMAEGGFVEEISTPATRAQLPPPNEQPLPWTQLIESVRASGPELPKRALSRF